MPSRKQRRRREKERRHEYELVLVDESGEERPIDAAELRAERREKDGGRAKGKDTKPAARRGSSRRPVREVKPPAWSRVWKRGLFFAVFMFLVLSFIGGKNRTIVSTLVPTALYTALFVPFLYLLDRTQYNQYLRRAGKQPQTQTPRGGRPKSGDASGSEAKGPAAGLRRAFRR